MKNRVYTFYMCVYLPETGKSADEEIVIILI